MKIKLFILLFITTIASCVTARGYYMTDKTVEQYGTRIYKVSYDNIWNEIKGTLITSGYEIAYENREKGIINTKQKVILLSANKGGQATVYSRQYLVSVIKISNEEIKVKLTPKLFKGNNDITKQEIWVIEGKDGEIELWNKFFEDLSGLL